MLKLKTTFKRNVINKNNELTQSAKTALSLVPLMKQRGKVMSVTEIAKHLNCSKEYGRVILAMLEELGEVKYTGPKRKYRLNKNYILCS
jgi:DNA-binding IclR family transcriptional regulator